jgi:putative transcriptional regulator
MLSSRFRTWMIWIGITLLSPMLVTVALPKPEATPQSTSLVGQLLVASPEMGDSRFEHAVILMVRHDKTGALGIVVNRPIEEIPLAKLLQALGQDGSGVTGQARIFAGGPVEPQIGFILHTTDYHRAGTIDVGRVAMTTGPQILRDIGHNQGPGKSLIAFGYAGWGPGQLEGELNLGAWFSVDGDPRLVFDADRDKLWDNATARRTVPL